MKKLFSIFSLVALTSAYGASSNGSYSNSSSTQTSTSTTYGLGGNPITTSTKVASNTVDGNTTTTTTTTASDGTTTTTTTTSSDGSGKCGTTGTNGTTGGIDVDTGTGDDFSGSFFTDESFLPLDFTFETNAICECAIFTPPAMFVPDHNINIEHSPFTHPPLNFPACCTESTCSSTGTNDCGCVPDPEPEEEGLCPPSKSSGVSTAASSNVNVASFATAQTVNGLCYTPEGQLLGSLELKIGKLGNAGTLKVSGKITNLKGKKFTAPAVTVAVAADNSLECNLSFGAPVGTLPIKIAAGSDSLAKSASSNGYDVQFGILGGKLLDGSVVFAFAGNPQFSLPAGFKMVMDESSWSEKGSISGGATFKFAKTSSPKVLGTSDGYAITGLDSENARGLKLRYAKKTGIVKGNYTIYASNIDNATGKPKLKKFKMKVSGFVFEGVGNGVVTGPDGADAGVFTLQ